MYRDEFFKNYPQFQESTEDELYCKFDENNYLVEAVLYHFSEVFNKKIKLISMFIRKDHITIERASFIDFNNFESPVKHSIESEKWKGDKGTITIRDKDQYEYTQNWTHEGKIKEVIAEMIAAFEKYKIKSDKVEVDEFLSIIQDITENDKLYEQSQFSNWPKNLTPERFETWRSFNPNLNPIHYSQFFDWIIETQNNPNELNQDRLGALLSLFVKINKL